jgi:hypothetical protein
MNMRSDKIFLIITRGFRNEHTMYVLTTSIVLGNVSPDSSLNSIPHFYLILQSRNSMLLSISASFLYDGIHV